MAKTWQKHGINMAKNMGKTWVKHGKSARTWQKHGKNMAKTWQKHGKNMAKTWQKHGQIPKITVITGQLHGISSKTSKITAP